MLTPVQFVRKLSLYTILAAFSVVSLFRRFCHVLWMRWTDGVLADVNTRAFIHYGIFARLKSLCMRLICDGVFQFESGFSGGSSVGCQQLTGYHTENSSLY